MFCFLAEALDGGEYLVGGLGPLVGFGVLVVALDEGANVGFELSGRGVDATPQLLAGEFGEPAFNLVGPAKACRNIPSGESDESSLEVTQANHRSK